MALSAGAQVDAATVVASPAHALVSALAALTPVTAGQDRVARCEYLAVAAHAPVAPVFVSLEHIARQHAPAWLLLADLYEEQRDPRWLAEATGAVRHYLEERPEDIAAWTRLSLLCRGQGDFQAEAQGLVSRSTQAGVSYDLTSEAAYRLNQLYADNQLQTMPEDDRMILCGTLLDVLDGAPNGELTATDFSRMAWLALTTKNDVRAKRYIADGVDRDPNNIHIKRLADRFLAH